MRFLVKVLLPLAYKHLAALLLVGLTTLALRPLDDFLGVQVIALVYLLPVLLSTYLWGLTTGILAGFASFLLFNYFFLPPYQTFAVHKSQDLITLTVFLIVAFVTSQLIDKAREGMRLAKSREWEATRMSELIVALAQLTEPRSIAGVLAEQTRESFPCQQVEVLAQAPGGAPVAVVLPDGSRLPGPPTVTYRMQTARGPEGEIRLWVSPPALLEDRRRLLTTTASQGALALERTRLAQAETRARILEETDRAKSSLLSSVSHELRSPLAAIKASVSSLRGDLVDWNSEARHDLLATIEEEADHLNFLVGNLLDMSRIEAGALKPHLRWNSLAEIANGVVKRMHKYLKNYRVTLQFPPDLPPVPADYVLIDQVFTNLISNSVKFAPLDSEIQLSAQVEGGCIHVVVTNQGPPVPEENLSRIFDKFNQVKAKGRVTGTGLGLSICKGIIEAHQGQIWAENTPCCFAFHFTLPLEPGGIKPQIPPEEENE